MHKINLIITALSFFVGSAQSIIPKISILSHNNDPHSAVKVIILYAWHDHIDTINNQTIAQQHAQETENLLEKLKKGENCINYYLEYNDFLQSAWQHFKGENSSTSVPLIDCAKNNNKESALNYVYSEKRTPQDFLLRDLLLQTEQFIQAVKTNHQFPSYFYTLTLATYLTTIEQRSQKVEHREQMPPMTGDMNAENKANTELLKEYLSTLCQRYTIATTDHFLKLVIRLSSEEKSKLFVLIAQEMARELKVSLLYDVLQACNNDLSTVNIVHVGAHHAAWLEKKLAKAGITNNDFLSITHARGFGANRLGVKQQPTDYPIDFDKAVYQALAERTLDTH